MTTAEGGAAKKARQFITEWLLPKIDARQVRKNCFHCRLSAAYATGIVSRSEIGDFLLWWCDRCDPLVAGALDGRLTSIRNYSQVLMFVEAIARPRASLGVWHVSFSRALAFLLG